MNSGAITAIGVGVSSSFNANSVVLTSPVSGIGIATNVPILGGITNTGTIIGLDGLDRSDARDGRLDGDQPGGRRARRQRESLGERRCARFLGRRIFNAVTAPAGNQDLVLITGQNATFAPSASVCGVSAFTVSPNARLNLQVTQTQAPSIAANAITLRRHAHLAPQGNLFAFAATPSVFKDVFVSGTPIRGAFANDRTRRSPLRRDAHA